MVAKFRTMVVFGLLAVWSTVPALACLPTQSMTQAEMACCKKMTGECQMGVAQHPCCNTSVNRADPVAKVEHDTSQSVPHIAVAAIVIESLLPMSIAHRFIKEAGLPPPSPPAANSILRI
jgi:hypothetical protein